MFDVISVGSNTVDAFAQTKHSELIKIYEDGKETDLLAYPTGAKILVEHLDFTTGGGGTNSAVCFSRLGLKAGYVGCMGQDRNAEIILDKLKREKVNTSLVVRKKGGTGYSIILDSIEHDRTILAYKGLNNNFLYTDIDKKKLKTKWFYFSAMMGKAFPTLEKLAAFAEKNKIKIAFNPSSYLAEKGAGYLKKIISRTETLILNKEEAALLVGKGTPAELCMNLAQLGPSYVLVTDGKKGAYSYHEGVFYTCGTGKVPPKETTGAGDAFASTFIACTIKGYSMEDAMKLATTNAESVISYHGAKNKLLSFGQLKNGLKKRPITVKKKRV